MKAIDNIPAEIKKTELYQVAKSLCDSLVESLNELPKNALLERYSHFENLPEFTESVIRILKKEYGFGHESFSGFVLRVASIKNIG